MSIFESQLDDDATCWKCGADQEFIDVFDDPEEGGESICAECFSRRDWEEQGVGDE